MTWESPCKILSPLIGIQSSCLDSAFLCPCHLPRYPYWPYLRGFGKACNTVLHWGSAFVAAAAPDDAYSLRVEVDELCS